MTKDPLRIIARLDIKNDNVVKGINLEGIRKVGSPKILAKKYYDEGIDEIIYMDAVASLYGRNSLKEVIVNAASEIFVPLTVGGGIRTLSDIRDVLNNGADKVAINTQAIKTPIFIKEAAEKIGSQAVVASIEAKRLSDNKWEAYYNNGREKSGKDVVEWCKECERLGAGELLVTSVDNEGLKKGMDLELLNILHKEINIPIIFSGGIGDYNSIIQVSPKADAIAIASSLHYNDLSINEIKKNLKENEIIVRTL